MAVQNVSAQDNTLPPPDRETSALPAPDRETSTLPAPSTPERAPGAAAPPRARPPRAAAAARSDAGSQASEGSEQQAAAPSQAQNEPVKAKKTIPAKGLYLGLMAGTAFPSFNTDGTGMSNYDIDSYPSVNGGLYFGRDFGLVTAQAEILFSMDWADIEYYYGYGLGYSDITVVESSLLIPFIFKLDLHLGPVVLQPLLGPYLNFAQGDLKEYYSGIQYDSYTNPLLGLMFGGTLGIKAGTGMFFLDTRYSIDLGKTKAGSNSMEIWQRSSLMLNLGYQFNFGGKK
jgi:hypothetical protein